LTGVSSTAPLNTRDFHQFIPAEDYFVMGSSKLEAAKVRSCCFTENRQSESFSTCIACSPLHLCWP